MAVTKAGFYLAFLGYYWFLKNGFGDMGLFCSIPQSMVLITLPIGGKDGVKYGLLPASSIFTGSVCCASVLD